MSRSVSFREEHYLFAGVVMTVLVSGTETDGRYALLVSRVPPGHATPPHLHDIETEISVVLKGELSAETNGVVRVAQTGETIQLPSGYVHRLINAGATDEAHLLLCAPSGFEQFVRSVGERVDDPNTPPRRLAAEEIQHMVAIAKTFGIHFYTDPSALSAPGPGPADTSLAGFEALGHRIEILARVSDSDDAIVILRANPIAPEAEASLLSNPSVFAATVDGGRQGTLSSLPLDGLLAITRMHVVRELQSSSPTSDGTSGRDAPPQQLLTRLQGL